MTGVDAIRVILIFVVLAGVGYAFLSIFSILRFFSAEKDATGLAPVPVSIIKPLKGSDPELYDNILSFCNQDYPQYEVLFGIADPGDEAVAEAERIISSLPGRDIRIVISDREIGANKKVSNLQGLLESAKYPLLAVSDSDMRVEPDYLRAIVSEYQGGEGTGLVTCLYKISDPKSIGAAFESLDIAIDFLPSVVVAGRLEGITFGLGASMLLSRSDLESVGGFAGIADYIADDYQLGNRLWEKGAKIVLSCYVIEDVAGRMSLRDHITHQLRWARTIRASRPLGMLGYGITHVLPFSILLVAISGGDALSLSMLGIAFIARLGLSFVIFKKVIRHGRWLRWLVLLPVKDCLSFVIWISGFLGTRVSWRGETYRILKGGRIRRM